MEKPQTMKGSKKVNRKDIIRGEDLPEYEGMEDLDVNADDPEEEIEATYEGDDMISVSKNAAEKLEFGFQFTAHEGDIGDESEDFGDMPDNLGRGHVYDSSLSVGGRHATDHDEIIDHIHYADPDEIGFAYGPDNYVDDEDEEY